MKVVNVDEVLKILHKYGKYIFVTDEKKYSDMVDEIANLRALEPKSEWEHDHEILKAYSDGANGVLDEIRAEIAKYGSIWVAYAITDETKTDKGIEKLVSDVLKQAKEQVLNVIDKYKAESEEKE